MREKREHLIQDLFFIAISVGVALYVVESGHIEQFIASLGGTGYLESFIAGALFTSVFTAIPAVALIAEFAPHYSPAVLIFIGALGSTIADYFLYIFLRDRITADAKYLLHGPSGRRFVHVLRRRHFYRFFPLIGAVMLISPLPDEPALAFLGVSRIKTRTLLALSFVTHAIGIVLIILAVEGAT